MAKFSKPVKGNHLFNNGLISALNEFNQFSRIDLSQSITNVKEIVHGGTGPLRRETDLHFDICYNHDGYRTNYIDAYEAYTPEDYDNSKLFSDALTSAKNYWDNTFKLSYSKHDAKNWMKDLIQALFNNAVDEPLYEFLVNSNTYMNEVQQRRTRLMAECERVCTAINNV